MQKNSTLIHELTHEQLVKLFEGLENQLNELNEKFEPKKPTEWLTRLEVAELLKVDLSTIHNWCKKQKLNPHFLGNRVYFRRSEIESVLEKYSVKKGGNGL